MTERASSRAHAELHQPLVRGVRGLVDRAQLLARQVGNLLRDRLEGVRAGLAHLRAHVVRLGDVELVRRARVPHAELVEGADPVSHPLACDEDRRANVEAEGVVLEGRPVAIPHEELDEADVRVVHLVLPPGEADPAALTTERSVAMTSSSRTKPWSRTRVPCSDAVSSTTLTEPSLAGAQEAACPDWVLKRLRLKYFPSSDDRCTQWGLTGRLRAR